MNERRPFQYAVLRVVPRVERGECVNVGVLLYCQDAGYLAVAVHLDAARLRALDRTVDLEVVRAALDGIRDVCAGTDGVAAASWPVRDRFGWLTAPRSTVVRAGPVHSGVTEDPVAQLDRLLIRLVR